MTRSSRRKFMLSALTASTAIGATSLFGWKWATAAPEGEFEIVKTPEEWKAQLTDMQYAVLREHATERPYTSPPNDRLL